MNSNRLRPLQQEGKPKYLSAIFIIFTAALVSLISVYWLYTLEPSLKNNALTSSTVLAQVHGKFIENTLSRKNKSLAEVNADIQEILLLINQESGAPFVLGIVIDLEDVTARELQLNGTQISYGSTDCRECFLSNVPLFNPNTRELIGVAKFYSNSGFYQTMVESVRLRLFGLTVMALLLLFVVWKSVSVLVNRIKQGEQKLYRVFDAAPFPMLLIDSRNQYIVHANKSAIEQLALASGTPLSDLDEPLRKAIDGMPVNGSLNNKEMCLPTLMGNEMGCAILSATNLQSNQEDYIVAGLVDITAIQEAKIAMDVARKKAEEASRAKSEFLATMSHEIRTPMNGILGMVQLLQKSNLNLYQREYIDAISRSGESLLLILNDILDFSRIEANHIELRRDDFDLAVLLDEISALVSPVVREKGISYYCNIAANVPRFIYGDVARLRQILINLVGNAVKFTHHGKVEINIESTSPDEFGSFSLKFSICDTGIGIPVEMQNRIFKRFTQVEQGASRRYGGSGLGLAIAKGLVELMDGEIGVESKPGVGSNFTFTVHVSCSINQLNLEEKIESYRLPQRKLLILVVEDVAINRKVVKGLLDTEGHQVIEATNGEEAVKQAAALRFDAILMDLQMPVLDGYEATRLIRTSNGLSSDTPIIALTANILQDEQERCIGIGMNGFIVKPFTLNKLNDELARVTE